MKKKKFKILFVSPFFPYPTLFGGVYDIWEKIVGLKKLNYEIDLVYTSKELPKEEEIAHVKKTIHNLYPVKRKNKIWQLLSKKPLQVVSRKKLKDIQLTDTYDLVVLESENVAYILKNKTLSYKKIALRVHNNESLYFNNLGRSTKNTLKKFYFFQESLKYKHFSKKVFQMMDRLWFISIDELYNFDPEKNKSIHLPPPINQKFIVQTLNSKNVLFIGSLFMDNNIEAIDWYLNKVHKEVLKKEPEYNLIVCGSTGDVNEKEIKHRFSKHNNITLFLNVKDLDPIYRKASVFINPMQSGAGVKIKSINAITNGLPLVATKIGSEGIGLVDKKMFMLANTPKDFLDNVLLMLKSKKKQEQVNNAQEYLKENGYLNVLKKEMILLDG